MKTWRTRVAAALLGLGVFTGVSLVMAEPAMAQDTYFASCGMGSQARTGVVRANPDRHNVVWQMYVEMGAVDWQIRDYDNNVIVGKGTVRTDTTIIKEGAIGGLYGRYFLYVGCHGGYARGMIAGADA